MRDFRQSDYHMRIWSFISNYSTLGGNKLAQPAGSIASDQNDYYELSATPGTGKAIHDSFI